MDPNFTIYNNESLNVNLNKNKDNDNDNKESFNKRNQRKSINIPDGSTQNNNDLNQISCGKSNFVINKIESSPSKN